MPAYRLGKAPKWRIRTAPGRRVLPLLSRGPHSLLVAPDQALHSVDVLGQLRPINLGPRSSSSTQVLQNGIGQCLVVPRIGVPSSGKVSTHRVDEIADHVLVCSEIRGARWLGTIGHHGEVIL